MIGTLAFALAVVVAGALFLFASDLADGQSMPELAPVPPPGDAPRVAIIVPARDEAHQIEACLRSLLAQDWPDLAVVCVDDRSSDGTADLALRLAAADPRLTVVRGSELPPGWVGKTHANVQGVRAAGECAWYLFTDADTIHAPGALPAAMAAAQRAQVGLYTLFTGLSLQTFWERALESNIISAIILAYPAWRVNDPKSALAIANGQYLLARRDAYEASGGHAAIPDRVADDLELARLFKSKGLGLRVGNGRELVSVRMYTSLREIWWGFVKNASAGVGGPLLALAAVPVILLSLLPWPVLPWALATGHRELAALAAAGIAAGLAQRAHLYWRMFKLPPVWTLAVPFAQLLFAGIVVHSAARQLRGKGPVWKGRSYPQAR